MRLFSGICFSAATFVAACATPPPQSMSVPGLEKSNAVVVEDLRPSSETQKGSFSLVVTSEAYGIYRISESRTSPTGIRLLAHRAYETLPALADAPILKVHHFVTYTNLQSELRKGAAGAALGGTIGAVVMGQSSSPKSEVNTVIIDSSVFQQTASDEHRRAFYTEAENPARTSVTVIYIETEILGRRIATRSLVPPLAPNPHPTLAEVTDICIANHLAFYKTKAPGTSSPKKATN